LSAFVLFTDFSLYDAIASEKEKENVIPKRPLMNVKIKSS